MPRARTLGVLCRKDDGSMGSSSHDQLPMRSGNDAGEAPFTRELAEPVAVTLIAWAAVGLVTAGITYGITLFLLAYFYAQWVRLHALVADPSSSELATGFPRICWIGVGCVPAAFLAFVMFDRSAGAGVSYAVVGAVYIIWAANRSLRLLSERRRRRSLQKRGFQFASLFMLAIASRARALGTRQEELRRRVAFQVEALLTLLAFGLAGFVSILGFLVDHRYGVHLTGGGAVSHTAAKRAASAYVAWHTVDFVPLLDVTKTLHWRLDRTLTYSWTASTFLLALKLFILVPVLRTAATIWNLREVSETKHDHRP